MSRRSLVIKVIRFERKGSIKEKSLQQNWKERVFPGRISLLGRTFLKFDGGLYGRRLFGKICGVQM